MMNVFSENDLEILIATKDRTNFDFLLVMFPFKHFSNYTILIVNQSKESFLTSDVPSVRVINSTEIGLSKSRNMAINNAAKKICLIADDDVVYSVDFEKEIIRAFGVFQKPSIITFNHKRLGKESSQNCSRKRYNHTFNTIGGICSIEIAFQLRDIKKYEIYFDEYFGLGSFFETGEEFLFLRKALKLNLKLYYYPTVIVSHPLLTSGEKQGDNRLIFARAALNYKIKGGLAYLWLIKYLLFLFRNNYIKKTELFNKFKIGLLGINKFKEFEKNRYC